VKIRIYPIVVLALQPENLTNMYGESFKVWRSASI